MPLQWISAALAVAAASALAIVSALERGCHPNVDVPSGSGRQVAGARVNAPKERQPLSTKTRHRP
jgi:hypothetical protein